jgi:hypothetical protein
MSCEPMTVGELKEELNLFDDNYKIHLPGKLSFYRIKQRGEEECCIEVNESYAFLSDDFKKRNPNVKVAFISTENVEWDESGIVGGPIDVEIR